MNKQTECDSSYDEFLKFDCKCDFHYARCSSCEAFWNAAWQKSREATIKEYENRKCENCKYILEFVPKSNKWCWCRFGIVSANDGECNNRDFACKSWEALH